MRPLAAALLALAACTATYADDQPSGHFGHDHDAMVRFHMHENYALYGAIELLLVHDKLDDARDLARAIGIAPEEVGLDAWAPQAATVRARALAVADATNIADACRRAAGMVEACANCHVQAHAVPEFRSPPPIPPDRGTTEARMTRHVWAVARIREGVVGGVDESWRAGLEVLVQAPLPWPDGSGKRAEMAKQLHDLAAAALLRRSTDHTDHNADRARAYGELLVTCAACHATTSAPQR